MITINADGTQMLAELLLTSACGCNIFSRRIYRFFADKNTEMSEKSVVLDLDI